MNQSIAAEWFGPKESFCRALLLSMRPEEQETAAEQRVEQVIEDVMWSAKDLLPTAKVGAFQSELERLVRRACDTWEIIRHIRGRFEPSFELVHLKDLEWQPPFLMQIPLVK